VAEVGAHAATNFDKIKAIDPDLVLTTSNSGPTVEGLTRLGIPFMAVPHASLAELYTAIERIGSRCGRPRTAGGLVAAIAADLDSLRRAAPRRAAGPLDVLVALDPLPVPPRRTLKSADRNGAEASIHYRGRCCCHQSRIFPP